MVLTVIFFLNLPVAWSRGLLNLNLSCIFSYNICIVLLFDQLKSWLTVKSLQIVIQDKLCCYIYHVLQENF